MAIPAPLEGHSHQSGGANTSYPPRGKAWVSAGVIFVLTAIALADRMAISMLIGPIKAEFGLGDFKASLLIGLSFTLFYVLFLFPIGAAADRYSRPRVLGVCLFIWSVATVLCGLAVGFVSLFLARMLMGAGEAAIAPCSHGIIGASFPRESLAKPLALQGIGFQVGPAAGVAAAGAILAAGNAGVFAGIPLLGDMAPWRVAFILIGLPGLLALLLIPLLTDPDADRRKAHRATSALPPPSPSEPLMPFLRANRLLMSTMVIGSGLSALGMATVTGWGPEYVQRSLQQSPAEAGATLGLLMLFAALLGQGTFAVVVDWFAARGMLDAPVRVGLVPVALSIPAGYLVYEAQDAASFYPLLFVFLLCITPFNALANTAVQQASPPGLRSRNSALLIFSISVIGYAVGPSLVGALSEYVFGEDNLGQAMQAVTVSAMMATFVLILLSRKPLLERMREKETDK